MSYNFTFDLSKVSCSLFNKIAKFSQQRKLHHKIGATSRAIAERWKISQKIGVPVGDAITIVEDLVDVCMSNVTQRERFLKAKKKALFLPHCARKHMDSKCKAKFNPDFASYICAACSKDCLVNKATKLAKSRGYDVYVLPGGSRIPKIISGNNYGGVVGVACCAELKLGMGLINQANIAAQGVPLIKNGCSSTKFSMKSLRAAL